MLPITCEEVMASLEQFESTCEKSKRKQQNQEVCNISPDFVFCIYSFIYFI